MDNLDIYGQPYGGGENWPKIRQALSDALRGVSYYPYDLVGAPVDIINMALKPVGLGSEQPVLGSDYLRNIAKSLGLAQDPTGSIPETAARIGAGFINPVAGARAVGQIPQAITRGSNITADKLVQMITQNPEATATRVIDETAMPFLNAVAPKATVARESLVEGVPAGQELIVHHNITPEKLAKVEKVGGMPVPSIAVSNVNNPLSGFGDITLIGGPEMATPSAKNPVFPFDAYTARAPRITYKFDAKSEKNLNNLFADVKGDIKNTSVYDLIDNWDSREYNDLMRAKFLKEKGTLPNASDFKDKWDYSRAIQVAVDANWPEYKSWVNDFDNRLADAGVNIQEKIFKGFSQSGNRRYVEANLENLVKEMKGGAGSEGINYGVGNLRAVASPKFKKLDDIKASREKIVPTEEFNKVKSEINDAYSDLSDRIAKLGDQEGYGYRPEDVLYDIGQSRNVNIIDRLKVGADDQLKADIGLFIKKLQKLPTEYFEIKPQRAVSVSEFKGAIVPADAPQSSVDYLRSQGIDRILFYSTPEERTQLFKQFKDQMFSAAPAVPAVGLGAGLLGEEEQY